MATGTTRVRTGLIKVDGLSELNRALRDMGPQMQKQLKAASKEIATFVANDARAAAEALGGVAAHVAPSIKPSSGALSAGVALGGPAYPMAGGAEFGAGNNKMRSRRTGEYVGFRQFEPWRGNSTNAGYFLYPSIRRDVDRIETEYTAAVEAVINRLGLSA